MPSVGLQSIWKPIMDKDAPSHRSALRDNKNVLVGSLILVTVMFVGALVYALFFGPDEPDLKAAGQPAAASQAYPATTPTTK